MIAIVSMWWLSIVIAVVSVGALYEIWRSGSRLAPLRATIAVTVATGMLTVLGLIAVLGHLPVAFAWSGIVAFALAWGEYVIALAAGRSDSDRRPGR